MNPLHYREGGDLQYRSMCSLATGTASPAAHLALAADKVTVSSEFNENAAASLLVDGNVAGSMFTTADNSYGAPAQKCPWIQIELPDETPVSHVELSTQHEGSQLFRLRRLFFMYESFSQTWDAGNSGQPEGNLAREQNAGLRVLLTNTARDRTATSAWHTASETRQWWKGTAAGDPCPDPDPVEVCEHVICKEGEGATCKDRFEASGAVATAKVTCGHKKGKYLTIELYGTVRIEIVKVEIVCHA